MHTEANVLNVEAQAPESAQSGASGPEGRRVKALLIEDNPGDARLIELMVSEAGGDYFEVEQVQRLKQGLSRLAEGGFGLVLCDLSLPDSHGLETFARLHAQAPQVPIIVLSGLNDTTVAVEAVHQGAQDF